MRKRAYADRALSLPNPSRLLGALPKRSWMKRLRRLGLEVLVPLWRSTASKSAATRSRWQWTWVSDDSVFKKYGDQSAIPGQKSASNMLDRWSVGTMPLSLPAEGQIAGGRVTHGSA